MPVQRYTFHQLSGAIGTADLWLRDGSKDPPRRFYPLLTLLALQPELQPEPSRCWRCRCGLT